MITMITKNIKTTGMISEASSESPNTKIIIKKAITSMKIKNFIRNVIKKEVIPKASFIFK